MVMAISVNGHCWYVFYWQEKVGSFSVDDLCRVFLDILCNYH